MHRLVIPFILLLLAILSVPACFSVSQQEQLLSNSGVIRSDDPDCLVQETPKDHDQALNENGFTLISWNMFKGNKKGWMKDLLTLSHDSDLLLIQEAYLTEALSDLLKASGNDWDMISAFRFKGIHAGVLTMGHIPSLNNCGQRVKEPIVLLPKSSLISFYSISGYPQALLVANIHAINFTPGLQRFSEQLQEIKAVLSKHQGPMVFAGDFNTWSESRMQILNRMIRELGMQQVEFVESQPVRFFGRHLDHIFYRDLTLHQAEAIAVSSSDHFPLKVRFSYASSSAQQL